MEDPIKLRERKQISRDIKGNGILNVSLINKNGCFEGCSDYCTNSVLIVRENESKTKAEEEAGRIRTRPSARCQSGKRERAKSFRR